MKVQLLSALLASACLAALPASAATSAVKIASDAIGGAVTSAKGPEAGVWVIAETTDTPTRFVKIVVTDDQGRYALPQLPKGNYKIWVRGYGLVDSSPVMSIPGRHLDLTAAVAPDGKAAAQYYPAEYWLALAHIPDGDLSPKEMGVAVKGCLQCHQLGDKATREIPPATMALGTFKTSLQAWERRTKSGPEGGQMNGMFMGLGAQRTMFSDWTDRIAAGDYPKEAPPRPAGDERNVVVTLWDWGNETTYSHDAAASSVLDPRINANGRVYGPGQYDDALMWVDPATNKLGQVTVPSKAQSGQGDSYTRDVSMFAPSPYWGSEKIWSAATQPRSSAIDAQGRVWIAARTHGGDVPDYCKNGAINKFAAYFPLSRGAKQVAFYDPKTDKLTELETCWYADHNQFASTKFAPGNAIVFGQNDTVGWIATDTWDKTHDEAQSEGWVPAVLDITGDGKVTKPWTEPNDPVDPKKDHRINFTCYSIAVSPADGSAWCSGIGASTRKLVRIALGANPPETAIGEMYVPPPDKGGPFTGAGGVDVDSQGVVWQNWRGTDQITAFDRRKCKVLSGPTIADGLHCPEGWTVYHTPGPSFQGAAVNANMTYLIAIDREGVLGLGKDFVVTQPVNSDGLLALNQQTGQWTRLHVPYPMGFLARNMNGRIDDPKTGWKGRGMWTSYSNMGVWHLEGGKGTKPKLVKIQIRPDPLAN